MTICASQIENYVYLNNIQCDCILFTYIFQIIKDEIFCYIKGCFRLTYLFVT